MFSLFQYQCQSSVTQKTVLVAGFLTLVAILSSCSSSSIYVPVGSAGERASNASRHHQVQRGETLYAIAFRYGLDYKRLAALNNIKPPYTIYVDQKLRLNTSTRPATTVSRQDRQKTADKTPTAPNSQKVLSKSQASSLAWQWPVKGDVVNGFSLSGRVNKGVDIKGKLGESVVAAADGKVVYAGGGLRGYGKLVIVKHNDVYLSAYGHNRSILVKEGENVKGGQVVAEIGSSSPGQEILHFEIRKNGKPEDPLRYLPNRRGTP